jgi:hypothetical protein
VAAKHSITSVDRRLVAWAHFWAAAASQTYETIESISKPDDPVGEIGRRDAMTLVLVDAARNVMRGAELAFGTDSPIVQEFIEQQPTLKALRDRFEHYEDYVVGKGDAQRAGRRRSGEALDLEEEGIRISASSGGGPEGHIVSVVVIERDSEDRAAEVTYEVPTRTIAVAVRCLARSLIKAAGLLNSPHLDRCELCANPAGI